MHSHRSPRGRIFFEVLSAVSVGASFVGAWIQTGAWAFLVPAFVFTLFGLYWSFDMFGRSAVAVAVQPGAAPEAAREIEPVAAPAAIRTFEPAEEYVAFDPEPAVEQPVALEIAGYAPEPAVEEKPKRRPKKAKPEAVAIVAEPVADPEPEPVIEPVIHQAPTVFEEAPSFEDEEHHEPHMEKLFDPQPFARQARPAFGKRPRGPGPRPLPA